MSDAVLQMAPKDLSFDTDAARGAAAPFSEAYRCAAPYPHICIDNFLPLEVLEQVEADIASLPEPERSFDRAQEKLKSAYNPDRLPFFTKALFHTFNSRPFVLFLEELTGIRGLIPDPYFIGAGIHRVANGGHLDIHADFNHHKQLNLERRLNVLIYLNRDWREEYGGSFEIWDRTMTNRVASFVPLFNRMVCFSTESETFHGNPEPVNHPDGTPRLSIALYSYTATWGPERKGHTTLFKPRPGTIDRADRHMARRAVLENVLPPIVYRRVIGPLSRLGF